MQQQNAKHLGALLLGVLLAGACGQAPQGPQPVEGSFTDEVGRVAAPLVATAVYDAALRVPRCSSAASGCDSGTLLDGRGPQGPEKNAPNTLGTTCADGTFGYYHSDESVDRVQIHTTDGSDLLPGKTVNLSVTVYAYISYTTDHLDLYHATDASNPNWTYITTLQPQGAGVQTLTTSFTLPAGASTQAVRAAFRYMGSASTCSMGAYDDRDDLAFSVTPPVSKGIGAGFYHGMSLHTDGTVWAWGFNGMGAVGDGTTNARLAPVQTLGLVNVRAVVAGGVHSLALKHDGTVWSWGDNTYGQGGVGSNSSNQTTPQQVVGLTGVKMLAGGGYHSLALKTDGTVWAWGHNANGQLGDGTTTSRNLPVQVLGLTNVVSVGAGQLHSLAVRSDGSVWAWGSNTGQALGDGTHTSRTTPVQVSGLPAGAVSVAGGRYHSLALKQDGTVWVWGGNTLGQSGTGSTATSLPSAVQVPGLTGVASIASGDSHSLVVKGDGTLWAWGNNANSQLGDGTATQRNTPIQVPGLTGVVAAAGGMYNSLAMKADGSGWAWGGNNVGQLGDGTSTPRSTPVQVY